jgi:hypothetical protein
MRLREIEQGDGVFIRPLFGFISLVSRMRLPDAARVAFYHKDFFCHSDGRMDPGGNAWTEYVERRRA